MYGYGVQYISLNIPGCTAKMTIVHEMLHTVGFDHEQNRCSLVCIYLAYCIFINTMLRLL